ncbi:unnamed protein product [Linum tenue]|uniref:Uncharacterized protein n=1 Tax=Linum tenue TaxID=586396 RepID=A0AAV0M023_9ROSI|nr:unnamed protein product [Linum tenue]
MHERDERRGRRALQGWPDRDGEDRRHVPGQQLQSDHRSVERSFRPDRRPQGRHHQHLF